jgi:hypothetical protein
MTNAKENAMNINIYKTVSGSRHNIKEDEIIRKNGRYIDIVTREDVILDQAASGTAILS